MADYDGGMHKYIPKEAETQIKNGEMKGGSFRRYWSTVASGVTHLKCPLALKGLCISKQYD